MYYIVGLGNPGVEYENTRHNVGYMAVEYLREQEGLLDFSADALLEVRRTEGRVAGQTVQCILPTTFMNHSGVAVKKVVPKEAVDKLIVVHDEVDLPLGQVRFSFNRGAGGHNGVESIINHLGRKDFVRVRIGIAPVNEETGQAARPTGDRLANFVLKKFRPEELEVVAGAVKEVKRLLEVMIERGLEVAMNDGNQGGFKKVE